MNGWVAGFLLLVVIGASNVVAKLVAHLELNTLVYVSQGMMAGAFALLLLARPGPLSVATIKHLNTWLYGIFFLVFNSIAIFTMRYIDVAVIMQLQRLATFLTFIAVVIFLNRRKTFWRQLPFQLVVLAGVITMGFDIPAIYFGIVIVCIVVMALLQTMKAITVETHKTNNQAKKFTSEIRVTAFVMAVTGGVSYITILALAGVQSISGGVLALGFIPSFKQIFNPYSLIFASIYGVFAFSAMRYLEFYTVKRIKSEGYMALLAFLPLAGLAFELISHLAGIVPMHKEPFSTNQTVSLVLIILGSLGLIFIGKKKPKRRLMPDNMARDKALASHTLQYCDGNVTQAAKLLKVSPAILNVALKEDDPAKALPEKLSQKIHDNFTKNVAFLDSLTGLMNKTHFLSLFKESLSKKEKGVVLYLDLNKFKPINDTLGHEVGDAVLRVVAERLRTNTDRGSQIARLGGDEFAVLLIGAKPEKAEAICQRLAAKIAEPMNIEGQAKPLKVGTSIGFANFPQDNKDATTMLAEADKAMYGEKKKR